MVRQPTWVGRLRRGMEPRLGSSVRARGRRPPGVRRILTEGPAADFASTGAQRLPVHLDPVAVWVEAFEPHVSRFIVPFHDGDASGLHASHQRAYISWLCGFEAGMQERRRRRSRSVVKSLCQPTRVTAQSGRLAAAPCHPGAAMHNTACCTKTDHRASVGSGDCQRPPFGYRVGRLPLMRRLLAHVWRSFSSGSLVRQAEQSFRACQAFRACRPTTIGRLRPVPPGGVRLWVPVAGVLRASGLRPGPAAAGSAGDRRCRGLRRRRGPRPRRRAGG